MPLSERENYLRNASMAGPEWIPMGVSISGATWNQLREEAEDVLVHHPVLFPDFQKGRQDFNVWDPGPAYRAGERFRDAWACVWLTSMDGIEGVVVEHPLDNWARFDSFSPPNPLVHGDRGPAGWESARREIEEKKEKRIHSIGFVPHGFLFMRLTYLRGFQNLLIDLVEEDPRLLRLIDMLTAHNRTIVDQWLSMGVDVVNFGEDLGTQKAPIISPAMFRRWIAPAYKALMQPCRDAGCHVVLHSDGYIMDLVRDFMDAGVTILNPQDLCNGIDNLAREVKGRMCIQLDIDRQKIVPFGTRNDIFDLIEEEVRKLGSPRGGLEMVAGIYPPTPPENIDALCCALEKFRTYWWEGSA